MASAYRIQWSSKCTNRNDICASGVPEFPEFPESATGEAECSSDCFRGLLVQSADDVSCMKGHVRRYSVIPGSYRTNSGLRFRTRVVRDLAPGVGDVWALVGYVSSEQVWHFAAWLG